MNVNDITIKGELKALACRLEALLISSSAPVSTAGDDYSSIDEVAQLTGFSRKTVQKWISHGKYDRKGKTIRLYTLKFTPGYPFVPRSALVAFGQGVGFNTSKPKLCIVPECSGVPVDVTFRTALWGKYSTAAPAQRRQHGALSSVVRKAYKA